MQYEIVSKVMGGVHVILAFLVLLLLLLKATLKMALGTGTDASPVAQRLLTIRHASEQVLVCSAPELTRYSGATRKN